MTCSIKKYDICLEKGATFDGLSVHWEKGGVVQDLTGYSAVWQVRPTKIDPTIVIESSTANGDLAIDGNNEIIFNIPASKTDLLTFTTGQYHCLEITKGTFVKRLFEGICSLNLGGNV